MLAGVVPLVGYVVADLWPDHRIGGNTLLANAAAVALALYMNICAWRAVRHPDACPNTRRAWRWMGLGATLNFGAELAWLEAENLLGYTEIPFGVHLLYFLAYGPFLLGLLALPPQLRTRNERTKFWLDALAVLIGGSMVVFATIIYPTLALPYSLTDRIASIAYPLGDLVLLLGVTTVLLRETAPAQRTVYALLLVGLSVWFLGDLGFSYLSVRHAYEGGSLLDLLWITAYWLVGEAARVQVNGDRLARLAAHGFEQPLRRFSLLPYLGVAFGYGILGVHALHNRDPLLVTLIAGAVLLTAVIIARQVVAVRENALLAAGNEAKKADARYRSLVQNSSDLITVLDADGTIRFLSPSVLRLTGYQPVEVVGRRVLEFLDERDASAACEAFSHALAGDVQQGVQLRLRRKDGSEVVLESVITSALQDTLVEGVIINARDVSQRNHAEARLRQTQQLEAAGRVAGGIAHDFNNLLTAIQGNAQLLLDDVPTDDPRRGELEEIDRASEVAAGLTRQLLAFSRHQVVQPRSLRPDEMVRDVERMARRIIRAEIRLVLDLRAPGAVIELDPHQLEQIVLNLLLNARDAIVGEGTIVVSSRLRQLAAHEPLCRAGASPGEWYVLSVQDDGVPVPTDLQDRIFEPFSSRKPVGSGTGLGLATVKDIVAHTGGWIVFEDAGGAGSSFTLGLPPAVLAPARVPLPAPLPVGAEPSLGTRPVVLLVDDEPAVRGLAQRVLERGGFTVHGACSGEEGLVLAGTLPRMDLLVSDMLMPGISGSELASQLRTRQPALPVILMSGYSDEDVGAQDTLDHATRFLQKPFPPSQLVELARLLA